jgi:hypothetical protein
LLSIKSAAIKCWEPYHRYFVIDRPWSKKIATHDLNGSQNVRRWFIEAGKLLFGEDPFLWQDAGAAKSMEPSCNGF